MRSPYALPALCAATTMLGASLLALGSARAQEPSLEQIVAGVQKVYAETRNFKAKFKQRLSLRATKRKRNAGGFITFQKPNQFRFNYTLGDEKKLIVSDGKIVWTYIIDDAQMRMDPFDPKLAASLRFLWGDGELKDQFNVTQQSAAWARKRGFGRKGDLFLELKPKADEGHYKKLIFVVEPASFEVRETIVYDPVGNVNHMTFINVKRNIVLDPRRFTLKPKAGVQVVKSPELKD